jgi:hypothetical protein
MKMRQLPWLALRIVTGVCALFVSLHGVWNLYGLDFRIDTVISTLYCLLPFLSFFVFLFAKPPRMQVLMHAMIAVGYLAAYSMLNWRTCSVFGYCVSVGATIFLTLRTKAVLAAFAVLVLSAVGLLFDTGPAAKSKSGVAK